ncbi:MAG: hypothetical protein JXB09_03285 [Deltaproteobacteria bacterium]|nr:hypothetical protein [Deltaproteobacteria bacterium]
MKTFRVIAGIIMVIVCSFSIAHAVPYNVAQGASVSLTGNFFTEYVDWSTAYPDGSPASQALIDSIVDGVFLPENTQWDQNTLWWDEHDQTQKTVTIDLGQDFAISSFLVQADDNDTYLISYWNQTANEWTIINQFGSWGMTTRPEYILTDTIITSQLSITAGPGGDLWYSLSEIQA